MSREVTKLDNIKKKLLGSPLLKQVLGGKHEKYILSVLSEINKTAGDDKKDLTGCDSASIITAIKQACDLQLEIDSRQHCHLVKYGNKVQLQVGYRGFIYAIKRCYPDANIDCHLVYQGDTFTVKKEGDNTTYSLEVANPFAAKDKVIGGFCYISYTAVDRLVSFCETMSLEEINKIKGCAKQDFIWNSWFEEKAKVAIIRRACKVHFSGIQEVNNLEDYDNESFKLDNNITDVTPPKEIELIDSEQGIILEGLAEKAGKDIKDICKIHKIESIIDLPLSKYDSVFQILGGINANS